MTQPPRRSLQEGLSRHGRWALRLPPPRSRAEDLYHAVRDAITRASDLAVAEREILRTRSA
jgi:hypothetical protein